MATEHLVTAREALARFVAELPVGGHHERLQRAAAVTRALIEDALTTESGASPWVDHNLGVVVAGALQEQASRRAGEALFIGVRRRLELALERDADDLVLALALSLGVASVGHDERHIPAFNAAIAAASKRHAGPRLVSAVVRMVVAASHSKVAELKTAAEEHAVALKGVVDDACRRLPRHPDLALDRVRLTLTAASRSQGEERGTLLGQAAALLTDHEDAFGGGSTSRKLRADIIAQLARGGGSGADVRRQALSLIEAGIQERSLHPKTAERLVRAVERSGGLDHKTAKRLTALFDGYLQDRGTGPWRKVLGVLLQNSGDQAGLVAHWERALLDDAKNSDAAKGLAGRLLRNLRASLQPPFSADVLDRVLGAIPFGAMAKWSADDAKLVLDATDEALGTARAAAFARDRLLEVREFKNKTALHNKALDLFKSLGDDEATLAFAERAAKIANHGRSQLLVAEALLAKGERLDEAESLLRPLLDVRGNLGKRAQQVRAKLAKHPAIRDSHKNALVAFEKKIGVGTATPFNLRVVFIGGNYALAEAYEHKAPDAYEHKHIRTMVRREDLPKGVTPSDLRKGDKLSAPLSGQDSNAKRDKTGLRVYWIADPTAVTVAMDRTAIDARWAKEEASYGIGPDGVVGLKIGWDGRRESLTARVFRANGKGAEFPIRPSVAAENLPEGVEPTSLGKNGKRFWGQVVRVEGGGPRAYTVQGTVSSNAPASETPAAEADPASAASSHQESEAAGPPETPAQTGKPENPTPAPAELAPAPTVQEGDAPVAETASNPEPPSGETDVVATADKADAGAEQ